VNQATTFAELAAEAQRQTLTALRQAQDLSLRGVELAVGLRDAERRSLPTPQEAVEGAFAFAGQLLQEQKAYALRMTEIVTGVAEPAPVETK
jgi:hypothetical protein